MRAGLFASCVVMAAAVAARAEVRVVRMPGQQLRLDVRPVGTQVWSPRGRLSADIVNPAGDAAGDSYPSSALGQDGRLVGAWTRASTGDLMVLRSEAPGTHRISPLTDALAVGAPETVAVDGGWLVAWSSLAAEPMVSATVVTPDENGTPEPLIPGRLVGVVQTGDVVHLLGHDASADHLHVVTLAFLPIPSPTPIPISRTIVTLGLRVTRTPTGSSSGAGSVADPTWEPCIEPHDDFALVAWAADGNRVGSIMLDELGVIDDARFVRGPQGACNAILRSLARR